VDWWLAGLLGVVQGVTEFLPISSSAHLRIVPELFGSKDFGASFTAVTQIGTIFSVLIYFRNDLIRIAKSLLKGIFNKRERNFDFNLGISILVATIPIALIGYLAQDFIRTTARNLYLVAIILLLFSFVMYLADRFNKQEREITQISGKHIFIIGLAQALALIPGFSRSGATITAARFLKIKRDAAARISFLLSVPAIVLSGLYETLDISKNNPVGWGPTILATLIAFVVGYLSIAWLIKWLGRNSLTSFVIYRIILAIIVLLLLNAQIINPI
jgi:undecaprenyl-diphosphatase